MKGRAGPTKMQVAVLVVLFFLNFSFSTVGCRAQKLEHAKQAL